MNRLGKIASAARRLRSATASSLMARELEDFSVADFEKCRSEARKIHSHIPSLKDTEFSSFAHPVWQEFDQAVTRYFLSDRFGWSFLRQPVIGKTMFVRAGGHWQREQLRFLRSVTRPSELRRLLRENRLGNPYITSIEMRSSHNTIHHLYHLLRYQQATRTDLGSLGSVVEFGGGYGNLARLACKLSPDLTYTIVDLPTLSCIQHVYLGTLFGCDRVHLVDGSGCLIPHKINLLPLPYVSRAANLQCELFVSTWALSECTLAAQRYVAERQYFGARRLLLAYQVNNDIFGSPDESITEPANFHHVFHEEMPFLPNAHYLFA